LQPSGIAGKQDISLKHDPAASICQGRKDPFLMQNAGVLSDGGDALTYEKTFSLFPGTIRTRNNLGPR
tara:strand:+ start:194 stop:397 length:204 start_codon:yes stop_codon:yes gene_type:complete